MPQPDAGVPLRRSPRTPPPPLAGFGAAAQAAARPVEPAPDPGPFEIPAFLRREAETPSPGPIVAEAPGRPLASGLGKIHFAPPTTMRSRAPERVCIRILGQPEQTQGLAAALAGAGTGSRPDPLAGAAREPHVPARALIAVQMMAPHDAFRIEPLSAPLQVLDTRRGACEWNFLVTPLAPGRHEVALVIAAGHAGDGQLVAEDVETMAAGIRVRLDPRHLAKRFWKRGAAAIGIALVTWLLTVNADAIRSAMSATNGAAEPRIVAPAAAQK